MAERGLLADSWIDAALHPQTPLLLDFLVRAADHALALIEDVEVMGTTFGHQF
jgi:hypothetical protein